MRILVYPHDLGMGGSQLNAIELAAAVRDLGHECVIFGRPGVLCDRINELGLEFIEAPIPRRRPSLAVIQRLQQVATERGIDVIHGYEWPPGLEAYFAARALPSTTPLCTVMSMAVAPFLPRSLPLIVGTRQIAAHELAAGRLGVDVLEPPVDLRHNHAPDDAALARFRERWHLGAVPIVACVGRLAAELKSEGLLTAIDVVESLAERHRCHLLLVGDGPARPAIAAAADRVNRRTGWNTIVLTGELADPRPAYAVADVALGMGGSALRALAFGKPLIVQGEHGFFRTLTPQSLSLFRWQGWYGVGAAGDDGHRILEQELRPLLQDPQQRELLGTFSLQTVREFALDTAASRQLAAYEASTRAAAGGRTGTLIESTATALGLLQHKVRRRLQRWRGVQRPDDFNVAPVAADVAAPDTLDDARAVGTGPIVYLPGVDWDSVPGTDHQLARALTTHREVIWVDPPVSLLRASAPGKVQRISSPVAGLTRLRTIAPPGVSRPVIRDIARLLQMRALLRHLHDLGSDPVAVIASTIDPSLFAARNLPGIKIYLATDDFVEAAGLWGMSPVYLSRARERNLAAAHLVLAVTPELANHLRRGPREPLWFPNGADLDRYRDIENATVAPDITLNSPIMGVVGQFNERTDLDLLTAVARDGMSLLLVGPMSFATAGARSTFEALAALPTVQWVGRVPAEALPGYLRVIDVGLTAYADSRFNRRSYPLKTLEYLAAGIPVVTTRVAPLDGFDDRFVRGASGAAEFVAEIRSLLSCDRPAAEIQSTVEAQGWDDRATRLVELVRGVR